MESILASEAPGAPGEEKTLCRGERRLLRAILERAIRDLEESKGLLRSDAAKWFFSKRKGIGSLWWVCHWLEIERRRVLKVLFDEGLL